MHSDRSTELLNVYLIAMCRRKGFTLAGFERVAGAEYAQSGLVATA